MKICKAFLILSIFITAIGCTAQQKNESPENNKTPVNEIPKYKYSDELFNTHISKDEKGNYYFLAGNNFYQMDQQNNIKKLFHGLIENKYLILDAKYYNGKVYLHGLKVNQTFKKGTLALATVDLNGNNFEYLSEDLVYSDRYIPGSAESFRIYNNKIYILDSYPPSGSTTPKVYIFSLDSHTIEDSQDASIYEERFSFYKNLFPEYPYNEIEHISGNNFYQFTKSENKEVVFSKYDAINKTTVQYNINEYYDTPNTGVVLNINLIDNHWILFSRKGVFKFDINFENMQQLLDSSTYDEYYKLIPKDNMIILEKGTRD